MQFGVVKSFGAFLSLTFALTIVVQAMARLFDRGGCQMARSISQPSDGAAVTMNTCVFYYFKTSSGCRGHNLVTIFPN